MNTDIDPTNRRNALIFSASRKGWLVAAEGEWGVQFKRSKIYNATFLWVGAALLVFGVGILVWLWGFMDYLMRRDQILLVSARDLGRDNLDSIYRRFH